MAVKQHKISNAVSCEIPGGQRLWIWEGGLDRGEEPFTTVSGKVAYQAPLEADPDDSVLLWLINDDGVPPDASSDTPGQLIYTDKNAQDQSVGNTAIPMYYFKMWQDLSLSYNKDTQTISFWGWVNVFTPQPMSTGDGGTVPVAPADRSRWYVSTKQNAGWGPPTFLCPCGSKPTPLDETNLVILKIDPRSPDTRLEQECTTKALMYTEGRLVPLGGGILAPVFRYPTVVYIDIDDEDRFEDNFPLTPQGAQEEIRIVAVTTPQTPTGCSSPDELRMGVNEIDTNDNTYATHNWARIFARDIDTTWGSRVMRFEEGQNLPLYIGNNGNPVLLAPAGEVMKAQIRGLVKVQDSVGTDSDTGIQGVYVVDVVDFSDGLSGNRLHHKHYCNVKDPWADIRRLSPGDMVEIHWDRYDGHWAILGRDTPEPQTVTSNSTSVSIEKIRVTTGIGSSKTGVNCPSGTTFLYDHQIDIDDRQNWAIGECLLLVESIPENTPASGKVACGKVKAITTSNSGTPLTVGLCIYQTTGAATCQTGCAKILQSPGSNVNALSCNTVSLTVTFDARQTYGGATGPACSVHTIPFDLERSYVKKVSCPGQGGSSKDVRVKVGSNLFAGFYDGTVYGGHFDSEDSDNLDMPQGLVAGASVLLVVLEEDQNNTDSLGTAPAAAQRLGIGSYVVGPIIGMSTEETPRPLVWVRGGSGTMSSGAIRTLPVGTYGAADSTTWGWAANGTPVTFTVVTKVGWDSSSGTLYQLARTVTTDARGLLRNISAETQTTIDTATACS